MSKGQDVDPNSRKMHSDWSQAWTEHREAYADRSQWLSKVREIYGVKEFPCYSTAGRKAIIPKLKKIKRRQTDV